MQLRTKIMAAFMLGYLGCASADVITIGADKWCPYNCEPGSDKPGFMVEITQLIFKRAGHEVVYKIIPWAQALEQVKTGKIQGAIAATPGNTRDLKISLVYPSREQARMRNVFFTPANSTWQFETLNSLNQKKIGLISGYAYPTIQPLLDSKQKTIQVSYAEGDDAVEKNVKKLAANGLDVYLEDAAVFNYAALTAGLTGKFREAGDDGSPAPDNNLYIGFTPASVNPKSLSYARILSEGMKAIRNSGELKTILAKYGTKDWQAK